MNKNTGNDKFVNMSEDDIKENLKTFLLEKFPENDKAYVEEKLNEIIPVLSFDEDDFVYNGGRKRRRSKNKTKKDKKSKSKSKTNKNRKPKVKKLTKTRKTIRRNNKTKRRNPRKQ
jgi:hypothetical protein